jgi:hypothetical protein
MLTPRQYETMGHIFTIVGIVMLITWAVTGFNDKDLWQDGMIFLLLRTLYNKEQESNDE